MHIYIGLSIVNDKWITAVNKIVDERNNDVYLVNNLFSNETLDLKKLKPFKVYPDSVGEFVTKDADGKLIYCGDEVKIAYYLIDNPSDKYTITAKVLFDEEAKIYYMRSENNKVFLFSGDSMHFISSIKRLKRI